MALQDIPREILFEQDLSYKKAAGLGDITSGSIGLVMAALIRKRIFKNRLAYELKRKNIDPKSPQADIVKKQLVKSMIKEIIATGAFGAIVGAGMGAATKAGTDMIGKAIQSKKPIASASDIQADQNKFMKSLANKERSNMKEIEKISKRLDKVLKDAPTKEPSGIVQRFFKRKEVLKNLKNK